VTEESVRRAVLQREADRVALARALHDEAAQTLANVALHLQICERAISVDVERGRTELANARTALGEAINRLRGQVFRLRPLMLEEVGVGGTLKRYVGTLPPSGIEVEVVDQLGASRLGKETELGLYRVAQAALENALAHAGAKKVTVAISPRELEVRDDGHGFDAPAALAKLDDAEAPSGLDTIVMWSKALGGDLDISSDAKGTRIRLVVPNRP